jgi:purine-binding chemotaxis protein CheW
MTAQLGGEVTNFKRKRLGLGNDVEPSADYLTVFIEDQIFGVPVLQIQDVLGNMKFTKVPLAPAEVSGALNLRGRIVTVINVRQRLGLPEYQGDAKPLSVVVEHENELYSLTIDQVGDVISIEDRHVDQCPPTLDTLWREISTGVYKTDNRIMLILDVSRLLESVH